MSSIEEAQKFLGIPVTGIADPFTNAAIRNFQLRNALMVSGELDDDTLESMGISNKPMSYIEKLEDSPMVTEPIEVAGDGTQDTDQNILIRKYLLPEGEFIKGPTPKWSLFLHHTAGWENPYQQVDIWAKDRQGPIGTHYVIGGTNPSTGARRFDGEIVQCIEDEHYAWHLTIGNSAVHRNSIGIELCNFGWVTKGGYMGKSGDWIGKDPSSFYTWFGFRLDKSQVVDLEFKFREKRYFHKYTNAQLDSLKFLINFICDRFSINIYNGIYERLKKGMHPAKAFEYWEEARNGKIRGVFCHSNVLASGKWDLAPQPDLIDMLLSL